MLIRWTITLSLTAALACFPALAGLARAQSPVANQTETDPAAYPTAVKIAKHAEGYRYATPAGLTLYMLDLRSARASRGEVIEYCIAACAANFTPLPAAADAKPVGQWRPVQSSRGSIWTYRQSPVYTFNGDKRPGELGGVGFEYTLIAIPYVPREPEYVAPPAALAVYAKGTWYLADRNGRALIRQRHRPECDETCEPPEPFRAGEAALPIGEWSVVHAGGYAQWAWRKQPVFVAATAAGLPLAPGQEPMVARLH